MARYHRPGGRGKRCRDIGEVSAYVLDLCPPNPEDKHREHRTHDFLQLIGDMYFTLFEALPRDDVEIVVGNRVDVIGPKSAIKPCSIVLIEYEDLTPYAKSKLEEVIPEIIKAREKVFVEFFNTAQPINIRFHMLELLPGIGKKTLMKILEAREKQPFQSFEDIRKRVRIDPVKVLTERILKELRMEDRYFLFVRPPAWVLRRRRDIIVYDVLPRLYERVASSEAPAGQQEGATRVDEEATGTGGAET